MYSTFLLAMTAQDLRTLQRLCACAPSAMGKPMVGYLASGRSRREGRSMPTAVYNETGSGHEPLLQQLRSHVVARGKIAPATPTSNERALGLGPQGQRKSSHPDRCRKVLVSHAGSQCRRLAGRCSIASWRWATSGASRISARAVSGR
jgi:hypothetical protein